MIYDAFGKLTAEYGQADEGMGGISYIQQDWQGSVRTITNEFGFVTARTDHTAFGETVGSGVGLRSAMQGYLGTVQTRQGYGLTERDDGTGLDHTWFRKNEGQAGKWTSPDPYLGSMQLDYPQSFNRYSYVANQPTNLVDPSGLIGGAPCSGGTAIYDRNGNFVRWDCPSTTIIVIIIWDDPLPMPIPTPPSDSGGGGGGAPVVVTPVAYSVNVDGPNLWACVQATAYAAAAAACTLTPGADPNYCQYLLQKAAEYAAKCAGDPKLPLVPDEKPKKQRPFSNGPLIAEASTGSPASNHGQGSTSAGRKT